MASPTPGNSSYFPPSLPVAALKHAAHFCRSPKLPVLHLSCTWRLQNTGPGWREGLTSLLGMGQHLCKAGLSCFEATEPSEEQVNAGASLQRALPRLWQRLRSRMFSHLSLRVGDNTHRHTYSLLGSCGMSNLLLWNGFSSSSFYSTPSPLRLVS